MTITITHKGITVCIQQLGHKPELAIQLIKETIDAINIVEPVSAMCEITKEELSAALQRTINCTLEKSEGYGK